MIYRQLLRKPDGRELWLYARTPLPEGLEAPIPDGEAPASGLSHLRWHPLRGEWVIYAGHRQHRTFLPPSGWNPLAPPAPGGPPTEVPAGPWQVAVFENRFAALSPSTVPPPQTIVDTRAAGGRCEVVVFTQDPAASLATLPLDHLALVLEVWAERTAALAQRDDVASVLIFENRGVEVGVTLPHPHGQIYAYPFVPPIPARHLASEQAHLARTGKPLLFTLLASELADGRRVLYTGPDAVSFVPVCARHPFETWVVPRRRAARLDHLDASERLDLARALRDALSRLDLLWDAPMPYVLIVYQAPTDGAQHEESHVHIQIYPAFRMPGRLKYLAGSELGAGAFTADLVPEQVAAQLRAVVVPS